MNIFTLVTFHFSMINIEKSGDHGLRKVGAKNNEKMSGESHDQNWKPSSGSKNRVGIMC